MRHSILSGQKDTICLDNDLSINSAPLFKINKDVFEQEEQGEQGKQEEQWTKGSSGPRGRGEQANMGIGQQGEQDNSLFLFLVFVSRISSRGG